MGIGQCPIKVFAYNAQQRTNKVSKHHGHLELENYRTTFLEESNHQSISITFGSIDRWSL